MAEVIGKIVVPENSNFYLVGGYTYISTELPSTQTGTIDTVSMYFKAGTTVTGVKIGTFYGSGYYYTCRNYISIPNNKILTGTQTNITGVNLPVVVGDFIGIYFDTGNLWFVNNLSYNQYYIDGNVLNSGQVGYYNNGKLTLSLSGSISSPTKKINTITYAKWNGLNPNKWNGL